MQKESIDSGFVSRAFSLGVDEVREAERGEHEGERAQGERRREVSAEETDFGRATQLKWDKRVKQTQF